MREKAVTLAGLRLKAALQLEKVGDKAGFECSTVCFGP